MQIWNNVKKPVAAVQIIKSVNTPYQKYDKLAEILNKNGYMVLCSKNSPQNGDIFTKTVEQETRILDKIKETYDLPLFLIGHGIGGFVAQEIISHTPRCNGTICNAGGENISKITRYQCAAITWICQCIFGRDANAKFVPQIYKYDNGLTYNHTYWILKGIKNIQYNKNKIIPQLFICGKRDIIGANNRLSWMLYNTYNRYDLHKLTFVLFPDVASPIESGENWMDVQGDILQFLAQHTSDAR